MISLLSLWKGCWNRKIWVYGGQTTRCMLKGRSGRCVQLFYFTSTILLRSISSAFSFLWVKVQLVLMEHHTPSQTQIPTRPSENPLLLVVLLGLTDYRNILHDNGLISSPGFVGYAGNATDWVLIVCEHVGLPFLRSIYWCCHFGNIGWLSDLFIAQPWG